MRIITAKFGRRIYRHAALVGLTVSLAALCNLERRSAARELALIAAQAEVVVFNNAIPAGVEQQFRAQFEPLLKVELSFANRVCTLSDEQRRTLITNSNAWLDEFIRDYAKQGGQPQMQGVWFGGGPNRPQMNDPRESVQAGVKKLVKADLSKEQAGLYVEESRKRAAFQKKVAVDNLVARIDKELKLAPEQREKLIKSLTDHWDKSWAPQLELFAQGMDIWPNVPDQWIRPHLTAVQQMAWNRLNKQSGQMFFGGQFFGMDGQVIDDIDLDEGKEKAADADEKRSPAADEAAGQANAYQAQ